MVLTLSRLERHVLAGLAIIVVVLAVLHEVVQLKELGAEIQVQLLDDYYTVLGVQTTATKQEIQTAFKRSTSNFNSRVQDEEARIKRARVVSAHETLSNPETRAAYDKRRRLVEMASKVIKATFVIIPMLVCSLLGMRMLLSLCKRRANRLDPRSFEGRVAAILARMETRCQVDIERESPSDKLGMQLVPVYGDRVLRVTEISDGAIEAHNRDVRGSATGRDSISSSASGKGLIGWRTPEVLQGDLLLDVNGVVGPEAMMRELRATASLRLSLRRPMRRAAPEQALLAWVTEVSLHRASPDERWGCELAPVDDGSDTLEVESVDGSMLRWNEMNPPHRVCRGDRVLAVNGHFGVDQILKELQDSGATSLTSTWTVARGVLPVPASPETMCGPFRKREGDKLGIRVGKALEQPLKGTVLELGAGASIIVKEVVRATSGDSTRFVVDEWNRRTSNDVSVARVLEGSALLAVNGRTDPAEFSSELSKQTVTLRLRPPYGAAPFKATLEPLAVQEPPQEHQRLAAMLSARAGQQRAQREEPAPRRFWLPAFLRPKPFEEQLRTAFASLRCEFSVEVFREDTERVGLQIQPSKDSSDLRVGGLEVSEVTAEGLLDRRNREILATYPAGGSGVRPPCVQVGDHLVMVNEVTASGLMVEVLSNPNVHALTMTFSRKAADASPGVWEAEVERLAGEGWGMELREQPAIASPAFRGALGALRIDAVEEGKAICRWNKSRMSESMGWTIQPGDLIVACEPEVGHKRMLERLQGADRARLTLLRWHAGPAPYERCDAVASHNSPRQFDVVLERTEPGTRLGIRLDPSPRDPTRTVVAEVLPEGLVEQHNKGAPCSTMVCKGDEVEAVNGQRNPARFGEGCQAARIVLSLARWDTDAAEHKPHVESDAGCAVLGAQRIPQSEAQTTRTTSLLSAKAPLEVPDLVPAASAAEEGADLKGREAVKPDAPALTPSGSVGAAPGFAASPAVAAELAGEAALPTQVEETSSSAADVSSLPESLPKLAAESQDTFSGSALTATQMAKENFLLKAEAQQLRARLAAETNAEELRTLRAQRDDLLAENERLRADAKRLGNSMPQAESQHAEIAELRSREKYLQEQIKRTTELEGANSKLKSDNQQMFEDQRRLQEQLSQRAALEEAHKELLCEREQLRMHLASITAAGANGAKTEARPADIQRLDARVAQLKDLSTSLLRTLEPS